MQLAFDLSIHNTSYCEVNVARVSMLSLTLSKFGKILHKQK